MILNKKYIVSYLSNICDGMPFYEYKDNALNMLDYVHSHFNEINNTRTPADIFVISVINFLCNYDSDTPDDAPYHVFDFSDVSFPRFEKYHNEDLVSDVLSSMMHIISSINKNNNLIEIDESKPLSDFLQMRSDIIFIATLRNEKFKFRFMDTILKVIPEKFQWIVETDLIYEDLTEMYEYIIEELSNLLYENGLEYETQNLLDGMTEELDDFDYYFEENDDEDEDD